MKPIGNLKRPGVAKVRSVLTRPVFAVLRAAAVGLPLGWGAALAQEPADQASPSSPSSPSSPVSLADTAAAHLARGQTADAITAYSAALSDNTLSNDRRATLLNDRGVAYTRAGQVKLAVEDFNAAATLFPEYAAVYNNRGNLLVSLGLMKEAMKDLNRAILLARRRHFRLYPRRPTQPADAGAVDRPRAGLPRDAPTPCRRTRFHTRPLRR